MGDHEEQVQQRPAETVEPEKAGHDSKDAGPLGKVEGQLPSPGTVAFIS
jgi:hypothetical protein